ncbi:MAG: hypothetical protein Kow00120_19840 [Anaerolineae bacterium]
MTLIVDGLEEGLGGAVAVVKLDALDGGIGERAFEASGLPGHPGYVLLTPDGEELWRSFGKLDSDALEAAVGDAIKGR